MPLPRVRFRYSWIYDSLLRVWLQKAYGKPKYKVLPWRSVIRYLEKMEKVWRKEEKKVLKELSLVTGLKWKEKVIDCYIVGRSMPFSYPMTIPARLNANDFIDVMTHELLHQIMAVQNWRKTDRAQNHFRKKYRAESWNTQIHVPLHAMHAAVVLKLYGSKRLAREIKNMQAYKDYRRSWQIVQRDGHENIVREFKKRIK